jgi:hypothetical protein
VKYLLVLLGILAFVLFLLVLGAIGLLVSMAVIGAVGRLWRLLNRSGGGRRS